jgi:hypothetical protein
MNPLHEDIVRYRECVRGVWNTYLRSGSTWDDCDEFKVVERVLFELIAMRSVRVNGTTAPTDLGLRVRLTEPEVPILVQRSAVEGNVVWGPWDRNVHPDETRLRFVEFFDWHQLGSRDLAYVQARVTQWNGHDELVGRLVLVEFRYVEIVADLQDAVSQ